jgi:tungstate transport system substrate-binding protein
MRLRHTVLLLSLLAACRSRPAPLRLGTTYTVQQSGALAVLESLWTGSPAFTTVVAPSGQILRAAANGDLDVVITHAPALEQRLLVGPGHALLRCPLAASRFAVVGPPADPARVATAATAAEAFRRIAAAGGPFVSRGDSSGTHVKELALWHAAGVTPAPRWYLESGADQAVTLHLADERRAYALADLPTYEPLHAVRGAPSGAASRRPGIRDVGDARRARRDARPPAPRRRAGVRAAAGQLRSYGETVREYPASGRSRKSGAATA